MLLTGIDRPSPPSGATLPGSTPGKGGLGRVFAPYGRGFDAGWWLCNHRCCAAIAVSRRTLELDPNLAEVYGNLGWAYAARGDTAEAIEYYQSGIDLDDTIGWMKDNLRLLLENSGKDYSPAWASDGPSPGSPRSLSNAIPDGAGVQGHGGVSCCSRHLRYSWAARRGLPSTTSILAAGGSS